MSEPGKGSGRRFHGTTLNGPRGGKDVRRLRILAWAVRVTAFAVLFYAVTAYAAAKRPKVKPNVLFIAVDDLRPELGCYGARHIRSPHIDRLAAGGVMFSRAFCMQAVCAPSRICLLTGMRPDTTGIYDLGTPFAPKHPDMISIPRHFKNNGYRTISLGKIYHHGKDDPEGWSEKPWRPQHGWPGYADPAEREIFRKNIEKVNWNWRKLDGLGPATEAADVPDEAYADGALTVRALETMREVKGEPFFLAVGYVKPHLAFAAPKKYWDMYRREDIKLPRNPNPPRDVPQIALHNWGELRSYSDIPGKGPLTEEKAKELIHGYYACVSFIDAQVGRLLDELDSLGLTENTIVVLWGDHGWHLLDHGLWCKHSNFEIATRAPLMFRYPERMKAGAKTDALAEFVDVYPTLCDLAGLPMPEELEGTSLVPVCENPDRPWKKAAFSQYPRWKGMGYSMRTDRYRYTEWRKKQDEEVKILGRELYDYEADPVGDVNLAGKSEYEELIGKLSKQLNAGWRKARP